MTRRPADSARTRTRFSAGAARACAAVAVLCALLTCGARRGEAASESARWLAEHMAFDASGVAAWRVSWADTQNPGFHILSGGAEVNLGLEFDGGVGFVLGGRFLLGRSQSGDYSARTTYAEALGHLAAQLRLTDLVRLSLGANAGRLWQCCGDPETPETSAFLVGGFFRLGLDFYPRTAATIKGLSLWLRMNIDGVPSQDPGSRIPSASMSLAVGLGLRI